MCWQQATVDKEGLPKQLTSAETKGEKEPATSEDRTVPPGGTAGQRP